MWRDRSDPADPLAGQPHTATGAGMRRLPTLLSFALNPFRILRLPVSATTSEAAIQAETVLTFAQMAMAPDAPDPLPWLPQPELPELQQAAQAVEEPLLRLRHQLQWFDFADDLRGAELAAALRERDVAAIDALFATTPASLPDDGGEAGPTMLDADSIARFAHAIDLANAHLLIAAALTAGMWPQAVGARPVASPSWQSMGAFEGWPQPHLELIGASPDAVELIRHHWNEALQGWVAVLDHPSFGALVSDRIARLDDDFAGADDADAVISAVRLQLADLAAQEARFLLIEGRERHAGAVIGALSESNLPSSVVVPAMRPVRMLLQGELGELDALLERAAPERLEPVAQYLRRLTSIRDRWAESDESGALGLADIVDQAAERAYLRIRQWLKPSPEADGLLAQVGEIASAQSLRERVAALREQQNEQRERICHFCKVNDPDYDCSVVLSGKKETGREEHFRSTTVFYEIRRGIVLRCARCAKFHDFERSIARWFTAITVIGAGIVAVMVFAAIPAAPEADPYAFTPPLPEISVSGSPEEEAARIGDDGDPANADEAGASTELLKPSANSVTVLTRDELRYCLAQDIRLTSAGFALDADKIGLEARMANDSPTRSEVDGYNAKLRRYNAAASDYDSRCNNRQFRSGDKTAVVGEIELKRKTFEAEGSKMLK